MRESRGEKTRRLFAGVFPVLYRSPYYYTVLVVCTDQSYTEYTPGGRGAAVGLRVEVARRAARV